MPTDLINDPRFRVEVISKYPSPQLTCYLAAKNDYSEDFVFDKEWPSETEAGEFLVKKILPVGHFGIVEHPHITFATAGIPHSAVMQLRTHRVGVSMDVQSSRYSGNRISDVAKGIRDIEDVFYLRPVGAYTDRQGKHYEYTEEVRERHLHQCLRASAVYRQDVEYYGLSEEHARGTIPHDLRQNFVLSVNLRSLWHILSLRMPNDAQLEIRTLCELMYPHAELWAPELMEWHTRKLKGKSKLAP